MANKKVLFDIKKVQFSKITEITEAGLPTYATPILVPGTVSLSLDSDSSLSPFYADGIAYYTPAGSTSYTGTLANANFTDEVLKTIFNWIVDNNGNLVETDDGANEFGMQFAVESDNGEVYFTIYRCSATKPSLNFQTKEASATINTQSLSITASPITTADGKNIVKSFCDKDGTNYATYFDAIVVPTFPSQI